MKVVYHFILDWLQVNEHYDQNNNVSKNNIQRTLVNVHTVLHEIFFTLMHAVNYQHLKKFVVPGVISFKTQYEQLLAQEYSANNHLTLTKNQFIEI